MKDYEDHYSREERKVGQAFTCGTETRVESHCEREKQVMSGESKGVTRLNKVMIAECCYRLVLNQRKVH